MHHFQHWWWAKDRSVDAVRRRTRLLDITDPLAPAVLTTATTSGFVRDVDLSGDILYALEGDQVSMLDISTPAEASIVGAVAGPIFLQRLGVWKGVAHVTYVEEDCALFLSDVSPPVSRLVSGSIALENPQG